MGACQYGGPELWSITIILISHPESSGHPPGALISYIYDISPCSACLDRLVAISGLRCYTIGMIVTRFSSQPRNPFVETALTYALTYVWAITHADFQPAVITILADKDYYSPAGSEGGAIPTKNGRFVDFNVSLSQAHKTGLGSSAALVTALTAAIVICYLPANIISLSTDSGKHRLHNLAQAAHCAAQGKIGSGFDVAAAVFGSCIYRRFSSSVLEDLIEPGAEGFAGVLKAVIDNEYPKSSWDAEINKSIAVIPSGLRLVMCDVNCGSETVGMVKKVLAWKKNSPDESTLLWETLQRRNEDLTSELQRLAQKSVSSPQDFVNLRAVLATIRSLLRRVSERADVPIEPKSQTDLLDTCSQAPGVVGGVVPGAGGFDAIALLVEDKEEIINALNSLLESYKIRKYNDDGPDFGSVRLLGVKQEFEGVKVEETRLYDNWIQ